jgi:hypothetical protein
MRRIAAMGLLAVTALFAAAVLVSEEKEKPIETLTCFAANMQRGRAGVIDINIYRWSTDQEREMLLTTLQEKGRDALVDALMSIRPRVGYMRTPNSIGRIVLATNRRVAFNEARNNTRSMQYQLTAIEIHLDKDGKGEGKMQPAAKISWDAKEKKIELENYNALPIDLVNVTAKTPKP